MRKAKEVALLKELEELTLTEEERKARDGKGSGNRGGTEEGDGEVKVEGGVGRAAAKRRRKRCRDGEEEKRKEKLAILQASARRIRQLEDQCQQLSLAHTRDTDSWQRWGDFLQKVAARHQGAAGDASALLSRLPPAACDCLTYLTHQHALYTSSFIRTNLCFALSAVPTGLVLDANDSFLHFTGWSRADILHHTFTKPYTHPLLRLPPPVRVCPLVRGGRRGTKWVEDREEVSQYPRSTEAKAAMMSGRVQTTHALWRSRMADGRVWEFFSASWISRWEEVAVEGMAEKLRVPLELSIMFEGRDDGLVQEIPPLHVEEDDE